MITVLLADDHPIVRDGVRVLLSRRPSTRVVADTSSGHEAVAFAKCHRPDVAVIDLSLPDLSGFGVISQITDAVPTTRSVVLSAHGELPFAARAFDLGASGFVVKDGAPDGLLRCIDAVLGGRRHVTASFTVHDVDEYLRQDGPRRWSLYERLTTREKEIFELVVRGRTAAQIGAVLAISPRTVETHRARLLAKLGVESTARLVAFAYQHGLVPGAPDAPA